ncbi:unnamed protein product, partial [Cladocopium goreaui]
MYFSLLTLLSCFTLQSGDTYKEAEFAAAQSQGQNQWSYSSWKDWEEDWDDGEGDWQSSRSSHPTTRGKSPSAHASRKPKGRRSKASKNHGGPKGRGKGKNAKSQDSAVTATSSPPPPTPWPSFEQPPALPATTQAVAPTTAALNQHNADWIAAIKQDYPDRSTMPENLRAMVEKHEKTQAKSAVKSLHSATTALDKAQRQLSETLDAKQKHRASWISHLTESLKVWEASLEEYRRHQAGLQELVAKAKEDITAARKDIERLNAQVGTQQNAQTPLAVETQPEDSTDCEEERLRAALQGTLQACAGSLGLQVATPSSPVQTIVSDEEKEGQPGKRLRAADQEGKMQPTAPKQNCKQLLTEITAPAPAIAKSEVPSRACQVHEPGLSSDSIIDFIPGAPAFGFHAGSSFSFVSVDNDPHEKPDMPKPRQSDAEDSLTDEFLQAVRAANEAIDNAPQFPNNEPELASQPAFIQELWEIWTAHATLGPGFVEPLARIETWYTDHRRQLRCLLPRVVVLPREFSTWEALILNAWTDVALQGVETSLHLVYPTPEDCAPGICAQIVVVQQPLEHMKSLVISVYDSARESQRPSSFCQVLPARLGIDEVLAATGLSEVCDTRLPQNECSLWYGTTPIRSGQRVFVRSGYALRLSVRRGLAIELPDLLQMSDHALRVQLQSAMWGVLYRRPPWPAFSGDVYAMPNSSHWPRAEPIEVADTHDEATASNERRLDVPDWIRSLRDIHFARAHVDDPEEGAILSVSVWFVHGHTEESCLHPKVVRLDADQFSWRSTMVVAWLDSIRRAQPIDFHVVTPLPPDVHGASSDVHVILSQQLFADQRAILVTAGIPDAEFSGKQRAAIVTGQVAAMDIRSVMPSALRTFGILQVSQGDYVFPEEQSFRVANGDSFVLSIAPVGSGRAGQATSAQHDEEAEDETLMLQLATFPRPVEPKADPTPAFHASPPSLVVAYCSRDDWPNQIAGTQIQLTPLPEGLDLTAHTLFAMSCPEHSCEPELAHKVALYVDGSVCAGHAAWSVVAVKYDAVGAPALQGCLSGTVPTSTECPQWIGAQSEDNISAELTAVVAAMVAALCMDSGESIVVRPDLKLSVKLATLEWQCSAHPELGRLCQVLGAWFRKIHGTFCEVRGHTKHPWNDLADSLARWSASSQLQCGDIDWLPFHELICSHDVNWAWLFNAGPSLHQCLPPGSAGGSWQITPSYRRTYMPQFLPPDETWIQFDFCIASANVLALSDELPDMPASTAADRAVRLDRQWHAQFDGGFAHDDHFPVVMACQGWLKSSLGARKTVWDPRAFVDPVKKKQFQDALQTMPIPDWSTHVDNHAALLEANVLQLAKQHFQKTSRDRMRPRLSESTRNFISFKRSCLDYGRSQQLMNDRTFRAQLRGLEKETRQRVRQDQRQFYDGLVHDLSKAGELHDARHVYKLLSRLGGRSPKRPTANALPLLKQNGAPVTSFPAQQRLWMKQFAEVEAANIMSRDEFSRLLPACLGIAPCDLAFEVFPDVHEVMQQIHRAKRGKAAHRRGLELTIGDGKTELLWALRGEGKKRILQETAVSGNSIAVPLPEPHLSLQLPVVLSYKHLGTWVQNDAKPLRAIRSRVSAAKQAWAPLVRPFLSKKGILMRTKLQVFESLVLSRFLFNAHTWSLVLPSQLAEWAAGLRPMLYSFAKPLLRGQAPFSFDVDTLCGVCELLAPLDLLHVARLRYFKRMLDHCPTTLWHMLKATAAAEGSWLDHLRGSFQWLCRFSHAKFGLSAEAGL